MRIETFRSQGNFTSRFDIIDSVMLCILCVLSRHGVWTGAGGQSVNTTDSAVRVVHVPTGTVVTCQNERSQHQNKSVAMKVLHSKLWKLELDKNMSGKEMSKVGSADHAWGSQIRSMVLHPYTLVKDHRTGWETVNIKKMLAGELLNEAIEFYILYELKRRAEI